MFLGHLSLGDLWIVSNFGKLTVVADVVDNPKVHETSEYESTQSRDGIEVDVTFELLTPHYQKLSPNIAS